MKKITLLLILFSVTLFSQPTRFANGVKVPGVVPITPEGGVGINTTTPEAALDIVSLTQGILIPRVTTIQRDLFVDPKVSELIYNLDSGYQYWDGSIWTDFGGGGGNQNLDQVATVGNTTEQQLNFGGGLLTGPITNHENPQGYLDFEAGGSRFVLQPDPGSGLLLNFDNTKISGFQVRTGVFQANENYTYAQGVLPPTDNTLTQALGVNEFGEFALKDLPTASGIQTISSTDGSISVNDSDPENIELVVNQDVLNQNFLPLTGTISREKSLRGPVQIDPNTCYFFANSYLPDSDIINTQQVIGFSNEKMVLSSIGPEAETSGIEFDINKMKIYSRVTEIGGKLTGFNQETPTDDKDYPQKKYVDDLFASGGGGVQSVTQGNNISITGNAANPIVNLASSIYLSDIGATGSITLGGSINGGVWNGSAIRTTHGGTGLTSLGTAGQTYRVKADLSGLEWYTPTTSGGTVTNFAFTNANGITGSVTNPTTTPTLVLSLGAITPTTVSSSGAVTATNIDATNKTDIAGKQPLDSDLTAIAALTTDSFGRGGLTQTSATNFRTYIGAGTGNALMSNSLSQFAATSSAEFSAVISDDTGSGSVVFSNAPNLVNPTVSTQTAGNNSILAASTSFVQTAANAKVSDAITDNVTTIAPSQNAVYDELQGYSKTITSSISAGTATTVTNEQVIQVITIPANSFKVGNFMSVLVRLMKTGNGNVSTIRLRLSTTTTGGVQIAQFSQAAAILETTLSRDTFMITAGNTITGFSATQSAQSDVAVGTASAPFTETFDPTITNYLIVTATPGGTDVSNTRGYLITRK